MIDPALILSAPKSPHVKRITHHDILNMHGVEGMLGVTAQGMVFRPSVAPFLAAHSAKKPPCSSFLVPELFC
ncbi:hypothetical protein M8J77_010425 [Diaphorina citri]|nr:hypothetical protein M8J77_010425 [Diaphorina citri]